MDLEKLKNADDRFHSRAKLLVVASFLAAGAFFAFSLVNMTEVSLAASLISPH